MTATVLPFARTPEPPPGPGTYLCSFTLPDGGSWGFEIHAESFEDAEKRLAAIKATAVIHGRLECVIPA